MKQINARTENAVPKRECLRIFFKDKDGKIDGIFEFQELLTPPNIALLMRRKFVSAAISRALCRNGTVTIETKS